MKQLISCTFEVEERHACMQKGWRLGEGHDARCARVLGECKKPLGRVFLGGAVSGHSNNNNNNNNNKSSE
jgi:hypothetical protein